ncbi:MAG: hypothetical protein IH987_03170 [Planctomycetes bacterium]|nr:hypothetical protein [Planctomycetota bacterium]
MTNRSLCAMIAVAGCIFAHGSALAVERCVDNPESGANRPDICVDWNQTGQPTLGFNFDVIFTDLANPDVTLFTGAAWNVRSKDNAGNPANIGDIKIDATVLSDAFDLTITDGAVPPGPGAVNVGAILLNDPDPLWTGHSSLLGGHITGDFSGELRARVDTSDNGGAVVLTIDGDFLDDLVIEKDGSDPAVDGYAGTLTLVINGQFRGGIAVGQIDYLEIEEVPYFANVRIIGDVAGDLIIRTLAGGSGTLLTLGANFGNCPLGKTSTLRNGGSVVIESFGSESWIDVFYDVKEGSNFTIEQLISGISRTFCKFYYYGFNGTLTLQNGIPDNTAIVFAHESPLLENGSVILKDENDVLQEMAGELYFDGGTRAGSAVVAGVLSGHFVPTAGGTVFCSAYGDGLPFAGTASFTEMTLNGVVFVDSIYPNVGLEGTISFDGDMKGSFSTCRIEGSDPCIEWNGTLDIGGDMTGQIFTVTGNHSPADMSGEILVGGLIDDTAIIDIGGDMSGLITSVGDMSGQISVGGLMSGELFVRGLIVDDPTRVEVEIVGAFSGNICAKNVAPGGPLDTGIITVGSMGAAELCGYTVNCLTASDCVDLVGVPPNEVPNTCTDDFCEQNYCWNPGNGSCGSYPPAPARPYLANQKNRYLSFDPGNTGSWAFAVEMTVGPGAPLELGWVGQQDGNGVSPVVADPYFSSDWTSVVHVADCEIVPVATYAISATTQQSPPHEPFTAALSVETIDEPAGGKFWGDVVGSIVDAVYTPPNGFTNVEDVTATIKGFQAVSNAAHFSWLDVQPECPNGVINFDDTLHVILAFTGAAYPFSDPLNCDPCTGPTTGNIDFLMVADHEVIDPDEQVVIDVHVEPALDVGVYEVSLEVSGGTTGSLDLTSMTVNKARSDYIFGTSSVADAVDDAGGRLAAAMTDGTGVDVTTANDYLGTFTFTASSDAGGVFEVKVRPIAEAYLSDSNVDPIGTSSGDSLFIGVDVECVIDAHCDDLDECTDDACVIFVCQNTNNFCDDANDCTSDTCNAGVCEHSNEPPGTPCEDGQFCTTPDTCNNKGACIGGPNDPCLPTEICIEFLDVCNPGS